MFWLFGNKTEPKRSGATSGTVPYLSVGWPIAALVSLIAIAGFSVLDGIAQDQDRAHEENAQFAISQALEVETQTNWTMAKEFAIWNEAFDRITVQNDRAWAQENMYSIHVSAMAVYRPNVGFIMLHTNPDADELKIVIEKQLPKFAMTQDVDAQALSNSPQRDTGKVDWFMIDGRLAAIAAIPLRRETEPDTLSGQSQPPKDLVVSITLVDAAKLKGIGTIAKSAKLTGLVDQSLPPISDGLSGTVIRDNAGTALAKITWKAERPGREAFARRVVPIALFLLFFSVLTVAVVRALAQKQSTLLAAFQAAEQSNKTKSAFLAVVSHELRTPLNTILGYAALIEDSAFDGNGEAIVADTKKITNSANHLLALVNDILDHSKIEAGKMDLVPEMTALEPLLLSVTGALETQISKAPCDFIVTIDPSLGNACIDPMRLKQCLINLLSNALKFTLSGSVTFSARALTKNGVPCFQISVKDTGIGMDAETLAKIFTPFVQANPAIASGFGGTGLGLTITRSLVEAMGGTLSVESGLGAGSNFTMTIPKHMI